jgi:hypothetical protein
MVSTSWRLRLLGWCVALAAHHAFAAEVDEHVRDIGRYYAQTEEQLPRSVHYVSEEKKDDATLVEQAWLTEARDFLKLASERRSAAGRELTEYFVVSDGGVYFVLTRRETPAPDGATRVEETRRYVYENRTIRLLTKDATFPAGEPLDTVKVKNVPVEVKLGPDASDGDAVGEQAMKIAKAAIAPGPPKHDPGAGEPGDAARYRLIQRTTSEDGRLALAIGFGLKGDPVKWGALASEVDEDTGYQQYTAEGPDVRNFVVDLTTHRILGQTGCHYFGTRHRYNHQEIAASWSPKDRFFAETFNSKWSTDEAVAGWIDREHGKAVATDLLKLATEQAYQFLAGRKNAAYRKHGKRFAVTVACEELLDDGTITLAVQGEIPKDEQSDSSFSVTERFRIKRDGAKAALQFLDARKGKPE